MQKKETRIYVGIVLLILCGLLYLLKSILTPFLAGALLAYLADPLVKKLMRLGMPRLPSAVIVFSFLLFLFVLMVLLVIPIIEKQINLLMATLPKTIEWLQNTIVPWMHETFGVDDQLIDVADMKTFVADNLSKAGGAAGWLMEKVIFSSAKVIEWVLGLILIPVVTFYLLCDWDKFIRGIRNLFPKRIEPTIVAITKDCDKVLHAFFRGQLLIMIILSFIYSIGLELVGLQVGIIIGTISGLLSIVPYLGFIVGIVAASIAAYVQSGTWMSVLSVVIVFSVVHIFENLVLVPQLMGDKIGLHPVAVIFAILAGGVLFGFVGVLLALPVAAVIMVLVRFLHKKYRNSALYKSHGHISE
jgi:predicted PurR-regulated permease PerM